MSSWNVVPASSGTGKKIGFIGISLIECQIKKTPARYREGVFGSLVRRLRKGLTASWADNVSYDYY
ncbi:hypothetical protein ABLA85_15005 [Xenorhabdus sp. SGI246]